MLIDPDCDLFDDADDEDDDCCTECGSAINIGQCSECVDCCEECRKDYSEWQYNNKDVVSHYLREDPDPGIIAAFIDNAKKVEVSTIGSTYGKTVIFAGLYYDDCVVMAKRMGVSGRWLWFNRADEVDHIKNTDMYAFVMVGDDTENGELNLVRRALRNAGVVEVNPIAETNIIQPPTHKYDNGKVLGDTRMERLKQKIEDTSRLVFVIAGNLRQGHNFIRQIETTSAFKCIVATNHEHIRGHNSTSYAYVTIGTWANNPDSVSVKLACQRAGLERFE
jgi:hypothetical protein